MYAGPQTMAATTPSLQSNSTTTAPPTATSTSADPGSTPPNKSLLFFVALGFGVVFTNLWYVNATILVLLLLIFYRIIVGIKYCFRYNQRARAGLANADNGDSMDMDNMPRPHRRRREKKLLSMEDVNHRFPLTKYKIWRANRESDGLPAAGGVTAPPSRAASIKEATSLHRISTEDPAKTSEPAQTHSVPKVKINTDVKDFADDAIVPLPTQETFHKSMDKGNDTSKYAARVSVEEKRSSCSTTGDMVNDDSARPTVIKEDEGEEDPIQTAVPTEILDAQPGDACAICIENIDDDDEVRALTCGHAFHAGCLDPWLTSRRACCPLCKADYYIPKPRSDGENSNSDADRHAEENQGNAEAPIFLGMRAGMPSRRFLINGNSFSVTNDRHGFPSFTRERPERQEPGSGTSRSRTSPARFTTWMRNIPQNIASARMPRRQSRREPTSNTAPSDPTPAQLEAAE